MLLKQVSLKNFRNVKAAEIELDPGANLVFGENAQGKTTLLEALYLLSAGKSFRTRHAREMIAYDEEEAAAEARFERKNDPNARLRVHLSRQENRKFFRNGVPASKLSEVIGHLSCVLFVPEHLSMVKEGPAVRRSFLDAAISALDPRYPSYLNDYKKLYEIRCNLIRQVKEDPKKRELFSLYTGKTAFLGAKITEKRREYVKNLTVHSAEQYRLLSDEREALSVSYLSDLPPEISGDELAAYYAERLEKDLERDIRCGFPVHGVHRDDLEFLLDGHAAKNFASQGQQRSIVLACKLSEGEIAEEICGETPVFLFDDVLSELDKKRRDYVLSELDGKQTVLTFCDPVRKKQLAGARRITVKGGRFTCI